MRIGVLTSVHPPTDTRILFKQAATLVRAGHTVYLVARSGNAAVGCGVHHIALPAPRSRTARLLTCLQLLRQALRLRCDVYHLHDPELLPLAALLKLATGAAIVFDVHEDVRRQIRNKYWIPAALRSPLARAYGVAERLCLLWVDRVVVAEDSYTSLYGTRQPVPIRNYPTLGVLAKVARWEGPRAYSGRPELVYCGTIARIRGALEMIEAVHLLAGKFPRVHLHLIGACFPEVLEQEIAARVRAHGLEAQVTMHGRMPLDRAMEVVSQCDIGLAILHPDPNYLHSLPTKMFEYMALRLPVIVSNFGLWRGIVDGTGAGVTVDPLSPHEIAAAVEHLAGTKETLAEMGERGCRAVRTTYSWEPEGERLVAMYAGLGAPARARADSAVAPPDSEMLATKPHVAAEPERSREVSCPRS
jgi:glycosyltransferase involved in cell wall biosynthesis